MIKDPITKEQIDEGNNIKKLGLENWPLYFGHQKRFQGFVKEAFSLLNLPKGSTFYEGSTGSHAIAVAAQEFGFVTHTNDISAYSEALGHVLYGTCEEKYLNQAALGCAAIEKYGFTLTEGQDGNTPLSVDEKSITIWKKKLLSLRHPVSKYSITRSDWKSFITNNTGDILYLDFAWPWKDGTATEEYQVTSDELSLLVAGIKGDILVPTSRTILDLVIWALDVGRRRFKYVILSNQSSNYPTHEILLPHMKVCGHIPWIMRSCTLPALYLDNLLKESHFTEYQYIFENLK